VIVVEDVDCFIEYFGNVLLKVIEEFMVCMVWLLCVLSVDDVLVIICSCCCYVVL